jgi:cytochrome c-type biogenesis protein CcmH
MRWLVLALGLLAAPAFAVQPDEMLSDPTLEARAREISKGLRCPVCQNENIDDSNAAISRELRILLRERLVEGDSDQEAVDFIVTRYGEFVLLKPDAEGANLVLWLASPLMALLGLGIGWTTIRRRKRTPDEALNAEEEARLEEILKS